MMRVTGEIQPATTPAKDSHITKGSEKISVDACQAASTHPVFQEEAGSFLYQDLNNVLKASAGCIHERRAAILPTSKDAYYM